MSGEEFRGGSLVWVKCGSVFWPGKVKDFSDLPSHIQEDFNEGGSKRPGLIVQFFDEPGYEFKKDAKGVWPYNHPEKKEEFIRKGIQKSKASSSSASYFSKFPSDVLQAEKILGKDGDMKIIERLSKTPEKSKAINYKEIFKSREDQELEKELAKKRKRGGGGDATPSPTTSKKGRKSGGGKSSPVKREISHPRFTGNSDHQVKIMQQPSTPYHLDLLQRQSSTGGSTSPTSTTPSSPAGSGGGKGAPANYNCSICGFSASRLNVIILHNKSHTAEQKAGGASTPKSSGGGVSRRKSTPIPKRTMDPIVKESPATKKRKAGRPPKIREEGDEKPAAAAVSESPKNSPEKTKKPPRLTKKKQKEIAAQETKKKELERKKILGDWSEDEEDEKVERKKMNESLGIDGSDEEQDFLGDDNLNQHFSDSDGELYEEEKDEELKKKKEEKAENVENGTANKDSSSKTEKAEPNGEKDKQNGNGIKPTSPTTIEDIDKVLEDTKVPDISIDDLKSPSEKPEGTPQQQQQAPLSKSKTSPNILSKRKSVSFAEKITKEIANTKITVMQSESNLNDPWDVEDEFIEEKSPPAPFRAAKKILKDTNENSDNNVTKAPESEDVTSPTKTATTSSVETTTTTETPASDESNTIVEKPTETETQQQQPSVEETEQQRQQPEVETPVIIANGGGGDTNEESATTTAETTSTTSNAVILTQQPGTTTVASLNNATTAVTAATAATADEEGTIYLLVDDGSVDNLNSQTLYIDQQSLTSGGLGNVVLMAAPDGEQVATAGSAVSAVVTTNSGGGGTQDILAMAMNEQQSVSKVPLITTQATPSAPIMAVEQAPPTVAVAPPQPEIVAAPAAAAAATADSSNV